MKKLSLFVPLVVVVLALAAASCTSDNADSNPAPAEIWGTNIVTSAALIKELSGPQKPTVVCVAPQFLYRSAHIPGAVFHGPTSSPAGLQELTTWARALDRSTPLVIYCGCCPMEDCPNLRPAYAALRDLGFTRLRVLVLPQNFGTDWVGAGGSVEKGE